MKLNPLGPFLIGVFVVCALGVGWFSIKYYFSMKELTRLSMRAVNINQTRNAVQSLANEALDYSRRNPAIDPLLERFEIKSKSTNAASVNPAPAQ